jgi:hypothetical protein
MTINGGTVTVGPAGGSNRAFLNSGTLTLSNGTLNVNGAFTNNATTGNVFTQSGGNINVDGNAAGVSANSVTGNITTFFTSTPTTVLLTGGTFTIVDPHASSTSAFALTLGGSTITNPSTNHTFRFGDGTSTDPGTTAGFYMSGSSSMNAGNIVVNGGTGVNRFVTTTSTIGLIGDLTVNANSEYRTSSGANYFAGNIVNNGILTNVNTITLTNYSTGVTTLAVTAPQNIGGSGIYRNAVPVATVGSGGTGYVVGDVVTVSGGTFTSATQFTFLQRCTNLSCYAYRWFGFGCNS